MGLSKFELVTDGGSTALSMILNAKLVGPQLVPVIPTYKPTDTVTPRIIFVIPSPAHTFNSESRPDFALKSRVPSFKERKSRNQIKRQT